MIIDNNFGNLCVKKGGSFQKERFSFFFSHQWGGGFDPRNPPPPLAYATAPLVLRYFPDNALHALSYIFNQSLCQGKFISMFKQAKIIPVFKKCVELQANKSTSFSIENS